MFEKYLTETVTTMNKKGAFVGSGESPPDLMYIGGCLMGWFWNRPVLIVPVRKSRRIYGVIERSKQFSVSVPRKDLSKVLIECAEAGDRYVNQFEHLHLHPRACRKIGGYIVGDCGLHYECRVIYTADMDKELVLSEIKADWYANDDYHSLFYGEIATVYET
ncbi:MAG: flavin reductase family protein [Firmicutes bacterium]|nr:flavin reductase family protein [Bacillota bacterium]